MNTVCKQIQKPANFVPQNNNNYSSNDKHLMEQSVALSQLNFLLLLAIIATAQHNIPHGTINFALLYVQITSSIEKQLFRREVIIIAIMLMRYHTSITAVVVVNIVYQSQTFLKIFGLVLFGEANDKHQNSLIREKDYYICVILPTKI